MIIANADVNFRGRTKRERIFDVLHQFLHSRDYEKLGWDDEQYDWNVNLFTDFMCDLFRTNFREIDAEIPENDDSLSEDHDIGYEEVKRKRTYSEEQILDLLLSMQIAITPEMFKSSKNLSPEDFPDLPACKADELGLNEKFEKMIESKIKDEYKD